MEKHKILEIKTNVIHKKALNILKLFNLKKLKCIYFLILRSFDWIMSLLFIWPQFFFSFFSNFKWNQKKKFGECPTECGWNQDSPLREFKVESELAVLEDQNHDPDNIPDQESSGYVSLTDSTL